ncbi:UNVERIFIED_CONTAM: hypothetical protein HDU68_003896 [Siphonaria sp. JEL0065]|nr:hypothetical protein HDU68_003896 [Siphonaria sp. JEL0065]
MVRPMTKRKAPTAKRRKSPLDIESKNVAVSSSRWVVHLLWIADSSSPSNNIKDFGSKTTIYALPPELLRHIVRYLPVGYLLNDLATSGKLFGGFILIDFGFALSHVVAQQSLDVTGSNGFPPGRKVHKGTATVVFQSVPLVYKTALYHEAFLGESNVIILTRGMPAWNRVYDPFWLNIPHTMADLIILKLHKSLEPARLARALEKNIAIFWAIDQQHTKALNSILSFAESPNFEAAFRRIARRYNLENRCNIDVVTAILNHPKRTRPLDVTNFLVNACWYGQTANLEFFLGAKNVKFNQPSVDSFLLSACRYGHSDITKLLLADARFLIEGPDAGKRCSDLLTATCTSHSYTTTGAIKILVEDGRILPDFNEAQPTFADLNAKLSLVQYAVESAISHDHEEIMLFVLAAFRFSVSEMTKLLKRASREGKVTVANSLLHRKLEDYTVSIKSKSKSKIPTRFNTKFEVNCRRVVELMQNSMIVDDVGDLLSWACDEDLKTVIKFLIRRGDDSRNAEAFIEALLYSVEVGDLVLVEQIFNCCGLVFEANVDEVLCFVLKHGSKECVSLFMQKKAFVLKAFDDGVTNGCVEAVEFLLKDDCLDLDVIKNALVKWVQTKKSKNREKIGELLRKRVSDNEYEA